ncbi:MAG: DUF475 domain-containing protein [Pseudomonadota bacterium]|nr:DUF475 domain-containing protein [Pseudomonadota bacterium]
MRRFWHHFAGSTLVALTGLGLAALYGWHETGSVAATMAMVWVVAVLAVLEISLSFDNAVVNAAVLAQMEPVWQKRFLTWGMVFAVFGVRIVFPLAIVALTAGIGPIDVVRLSLADPARYEAIVSHAHIAIAGFGGAFLVLVGLGYFIDTEKHVHWLGWAERRLQRFAIIKTGAVALLLGALLLIAQGLPVTQKAQFLSSGLIGAIAFIAVEALGRASDNYEARRAVNGPITGTVVRAGIGAFLYLNVLDMSFSLDGVIGAFALSRNMVIIAIGLSVGAVFVRSLTMLMVQKSTLAEYRYLEHGAFWAITALGVIMLISVRIAVPETVTGLVGAVLIGAALWSSMRNTS